MTDNDKSVHSSYLFYLCHWDVSFLYSMLIIEKIERIMSKVSKKMNR